MTTGKELHSLAEEAKQSRLAELRETLRAVHDEAEGDALSRAAAALDYANSLVAPFHDRLTAAWADPATAAAGTFPWDSDEHVEYCARWFLHCEAVQIVDAAVDGAFTARP